MTILYEGFRGIAAHPISGWLLIGIGIFFFCGFIFLLRNENEDSTTAIVLIIAIVLFIFGVIIKKDNRFPIIKATINKEVSWIQITQDFDLEEIEGQIYTFKVKNVTNQEWENHLKEKENE